MLIEPSQIPDSVQGWQPTVTNARPVTVASPEDGSVTTSPQLHEPASATAENLG